MGRVLVAKDVEAAVKGGSVYAAELVVTAPLTAEEHAHSTNWFT